MLDLLTTLFLLILATPAIAVILGHIIRRTSHPSAVRRDTDNRVWVNGKEVTSQPIHTWEHNHGH